MSFEVAGADKEAPKKETVNFENCATSVPKGAVVNFEEKLAFRFLKKKSGIYSEGFCI